MRLYRTIFAVGGLSLLLASMLQAQAPVVSVGPMPGYDGGIVPASAVWDAGAIEGVVLDPACMAGECIGGGSGRAPYPARFWGRAEYLLWWLDRRFVPPLVTTGLTTTDPAQVGQFDQPDTVVLFGGKKIDAGGQNGAGLELGYWLSADQLVGVGGRFRDIEADDEGFRMFSTGDPVLTRPFFNALDGVEDAVLVAYPGISEGTVSAANSTSLEIGEAFLRLLLYTGYGNRVDLIGGYQYAEIIDQLLVGHVLESVDPDGPIFEGTVIDSFDLFHAENEYHGGFVGLYTQGADGPLIWRLITKVAFGNLKETVTIQGSTTTTDENGVANTVDSGLLAQDSNSGVYEFDEFVIMPELDVSVRYQVSRHVGVTLGYQFVYWTDMALAGRVVDLNVNPVQVGGAAAPEFRRNDTHFWAQGLSAGLDFRF